MRQCQSVELITDQPWVILNVTKMSGAGSMTA